MATRSPQRQLRRTPPPGLNQQQQQQQQQQQLQSASRSMLQYGGTPTFASPTHASKARFYPDHIKSPALAPSRDTTPTQNGSTHRARAPSNAPKPQQDQEEENPFGRRTHTIGGERFPVRKGQPAPFPIEEINPYNPKARLLEAAQSATNKINNRNSPAQARYSTSSVRSATNRAPKNGQQSPYIDRARDSTRPRAPSRTNTPVRQNTTKEPRRRSSGRIESASQANNTVQPLEQSQRKEPELPRTPSRRGSKEMVSDRSKQRDLEHLITSGGKLKRNSAMRNNDMGQQGSPSAARKSKRKRISVGSGIAPKAMSTDEEKEWTLLEARSRRLMAEIAAAEEEEEGVEREMDMFEKFGEADKVGMSSLIDELLNLNTNDLTTQITKTPPVVIETIPNFLPLKSTDSLPQLRAYSTLVFTDSSTEHLPSSIRRKTIQGHSHDSLLTFSLALDIDNAPPSSVKSLDITVSPWAKSELKNSLEMSAESKNLNNALYSISSYTGMAKRRAMAWSQLESRYPELLVDHVVAKVGWKPDAAATVDNDDEDDDEPSRRQLVYFLPQQTMRFHKDAAEGEGLQLLVTWKIIVNAAGEACAEYTASVALPSNWAEADESNSARKVPETLNSLIKERGPLLGIVALIEMFADKF